MSEWKEVALQDVVTILGDGLHGTPNYSDDGEYYFINGNNLRNGKIVVDERTKKASIEEYKKYKKDLNERTILVSINGTLGNVALFNNEKCFLGKSACYFNVRDDVDKLFIKYVVTNRHFQKYIDIFAHGSTIKNVSLKTIREYPFELPPLPEQRAIAGVLSSLDDKIDLLHRQNQTLEALAQTLFRQWFVEEAEDDWEEGVLGDVIEIFDSKRIPLSKMEREKMKEGKLYPYYGAASIMDYVNDYLFDGEYILLGEDGTVLTDEGYPVLQYATGKFWVNNHTHVIQAKYPYSNYFIWTYLQKKSIRDIVTGAVQPKINQKNLKSIDFPKYPIEKINDFNKQLSPLFEKKITNNSQIHTLEKLRDMLLPKLMSGEVRIRGGIL